VDHCYLREEIFHSVIFSYITRMHLLSCVTTLLFFLVFEFWNSIYDSTSCRVLEWFESLNRRDLYMMAHDILILVVLLLLLKFLLPMRNLILV
jgi:hypothetical protein